MIISRMSEMDPNLYVMQNRNCLIGTQIMSDEIKSYELAQERPWRRNLDIKVNDLHGMTYLDLDVEDYTASYGTLKGCITTL